MKDLYLVQFGSRGKTKAIDVLMRKGHDSFVNLDSHTQTKQNKNFKKCKQNPNQPTKPNQIKHLNVNSKVNLGIGGSGCGDGGFLISCHYVL